MSDQREASLVERLRSVQAEERFWGYHVWIKDVREMKDLLREAADEIDSLERKGKDLCCAYGNSLMEIADLKARASRYKAALEWYANGNHLMMIPNKATGEDEIHVSDLGSHARAALEADGEGTWATQNKQQ